MKKINKQRKNFLEDTIAHYEIHPRCVTFCEGSDWKGDTTYEWGMVTYAGETLKLNSEGCAIGRYLPKNIALEIDQKYGEVGLPKIWNYLPESLKELGMDFLTEVMCLHDNDKWWFNGKLSEEGLEFYEEILTKFIKQ